MHSELSPVFPRGILVVDDDPDILRIYVDFLESEGLGMEVLSAKHGEDAVHLVREAARIGRPLVGGFIDLSLGKGIDGIETLKEIWTIDSGFLGSIVTGHTEVEIRRIGDQLGPEQRGKWDYLNKPFTQGEISQKALSMSAARARSSCGDGTDAALKSILLAANLAVDLLDGERSPEKVREQLMTIQSIAQGELDGRLFSAPLE